MSTHKTLVRALAQAQSEMDHAHWLEQQLGMIERLGIELYTQSQLGEAKPHA